MTLVTFVAHTNVPDYDKFPDTEAGVVTMPMRDDAILFKGKTYFVSGREYDVTNQKWKIYLRNIHTRIA